jgi:O-antigen/teichoic acid export membrane protein
MPDLPTVRPRPVRRTGVNLAVSLVGQLVGKASTLAWTLVAARELSRSGYGIFFYAYALAGLASAVAEWGFDPVMIERVSRDPSRVDVDYTNAQAAQTAIAVPAFTVAAVLAAVSPRAGSERLAVILVCVAVLFDLWTDTARAVGSALRNQVPTSRALVVQRGVTAVAAIVTLVLGGGVLGLCTAFAAGSAVGVAVHHHALRGLGVRLRIRTVRASTLLATARDCATLGVTVVVMMALFRLDAVLLGVFKGAAAVGSYAVAYRLFETTLFLTFSVQGATFPVMAAADDPATIGREASRGLALAGSAYAMFFAVCLCDAPGVIRLLFGSAYTHVSAGALRWLAAAPMCYLAGALCTSALQAVRRRPMILASSVVALAVNVALNLILIPRMSGTGAALATTVSYAVLAAVALVGLARAGVRVPLSRALVAPVLTGAAMAGVLVALPLSTVPDVVVATAVVTAMWVAVLAARDPQQRWRSPLSLIGRMGGSAPGPMP